MTFSYLVTQEKLESYSNSQSWMRKAKDDFYMRLTNKQFPCLFALNAFCNKGILFLFIDDKQSLLLNGLMEYISFVKNTPIKNRLTNPLVMFLSRNLIHWKKNMFLRGSKFNSCMTMTHNPILPIFHLIQIVRNGVFAFRILSYL